MLFFSSYFPFLQKNRQGIDGREVEKIIIEDDPNRFCACALLHSYRLPDHLGQEIKPTAQQRRQLFSVGFQAFMPGSIMGFFKSPNTHPCEFFFIV
jgi:hypothetical protein